MEFGTGAHAHQYQLVASDSSATMGNADSENTPVTPMADVRRGSIFRRSMWGLCATAGAVLFASSSMRHGGSDQAGPQQTTSSFDSSPSSVTVDSTVLRATISNEYTRGEAGPSALQYPWLANRTVMEPHREMTVELEGTLLDTSGLDYTVTFVDLSKEGTSASATAIADATISPSTPATVTLVATGTYRMTVLAVDASSEAVVAEYSADIVCKYVRRELRDLLRDDRERLLKAMEITYRVPTATGRQLYGPSYQSAGEFIRAHNSMAGKRDCDHMVSERRSKPSS